MQGGQAPSETHSAKRDRQEHQGGSSRFPWRLTVNEALTLLVALGSLAVSYLTLRNAEDTSDLKAAVAGLTQLVAEAHDQTIAVQAQARAAQEQLRAMTMAQRAWLLVDDLTMVAMQHFPAGAGIVAFASYKITNAGHSPADHISINTKLILRKIEKFDVQATRSLCRPQLTGAERSLSQYRETLLPGQSETIQATLSGAGSFARTSEDLYAVWVQQNIRNTPRQPQPLYVSPILAGCITYRVAGDDALHQTGFAFDAINDTIMAFAIDLSQKGPVATGPVVIKSAEYGNFAD